MRLVVFLLAFALFLPSCSQESNESFSNSMTALEVGKPFPDIVLPSLEDGSPSSIQQFRGRKVLLHIFASW